MGELFEFSNTFFLYTAHINYKVVPLIPTSGYMKHEILVSHTGCLSQRPKLPVRETLVWMTRQYRQVNGHQVNGRKIDAIRSMAVRSMVPKIDGRKIDGPILVGDCLGKHVHNTHFSHIIYTHFSHTLFTHTFHTHPVSG